ncbi:hypothetical protein F511_38667 [Dorcoceras hygrometricum]|uniref:Dystroglycan-like n=1 Tax=Dorcoceras hygrometricum TaxID=472368 RepID=A0A2Z7CX93_9LAMI|nr:hypothetical protein F511_38667 [Dorcoceras hygrometricum]
MASSLYSNAQHVDFESVLGMDDPGMVSMFEALMASGLRGFLGCPAVVYEDALVDFFENASVRNGVVISTVGGQLVEISEKLFAETFELPVDGLGDLSEMPKDAIFYARSIVLLSGEPISLSGRKNQMKMPFRLLCDILAKAISVKAGSFNAITVEKFSLMTMVVCCVKMNWATFLFGVLKKMVSAGSKQAKGFAIQISLLLATFPSVELGESSEFPASKILSKKTVLRFVSINDRDGAEEVAGAVKKNAVSKKRPAADVEAAVPKKKRTSKKKSISSISSLEMVAVAEEAVPIQQVAEPLVVEEPRCSSADAVDLIIQQVLDETRAADAPADTAEPAVTEEKNWFDLPYDDLVKQWETESPVVTASDTEDEIATVDVAPAVAVQQVEEFVAPISAVDTLNADEQMSLDDILLTIPVDIPLPSTCMEVTKIKMGQMIKIPGVTEKTWFLNSLPRIPVNDKGKQILVEKEPVKGNPAAEHYSLICADIDLLVSLRAQVIDEVASFFHSFSLKKLATINFEEMYRKEEQVLSWGETESPQEAIQRKFYIFLKYRTILVWKFLEAWRANFALGQGSSAVDIQVIEGGTQSCFVSADEVISRSFLEEISSWLTGCPVVGREKLATRFPNDWLDQTMSYQLIQTTSFAMHPRMIEYNAVALDWMYKLPAALQLNFLHRSSSLRLFLASVPAGPLAPADLSSSAEHDVVTDYIIIDGPLRCSSCFSFDVPADPSSSSSACSWFISYQLIHYAPAGSTWPPPEFEHLT